MLRAWQEAIRKNDIARLIDSLRSLIGRIYLIASFEESTLEVVFTRHLTKVTYNESLCMITIENKLLHLQNFSIDALKVPAINKG